jgi:streptogrisin C
MPSFVLSVVGFLVWALLLGPLEVTAWAQAGVEEGQATTDTPSMPSSLEPAVGDFARARHISLAEAQRRLQWQRRADLLAQDLQTVLGDAFGGLWVDEADGDRIKVGVLGGPEEVKVQAAVAESATQRRLPDVVDIVSVQYSLAFLHAIIDEISAELEPVNAAVAWPLEVGILADDRNVVQLRLPRSQPLTPAQHILVNKAMRRYGAALRLDVYEQPPQADACHFPTCDPPLRAGVRITQADRGCTAGFLAQSRVDSKQYLLTAGHCVVDGYTEEWSAEFANSQGHVIGKVHNFRWDAAGDMAILRINNPTGWNPQPWVYVTASPSTTEDPDYLIINDGWSAPLLHKRVCKTGAFGGTSCGKVEAIGVTLTYSGVTVKGLARASYCRTGGDSGGPVFVGHVAYGMHVAGRGECMGYYQGIHGIEEAMNVHVLPSR